jgi:hypothetical protein
MGSIGGALGVARGAGGDLGRALATSARTAFMSGPEVSFIVGGAVAIGGVLIVFALLPTEA